MSETTKTKTMWRVNRWSHEIERVAVVKQTKCFVTYTAINFAGRTMIRRESNENYYDTWESARDAVVARCRKDVKVRKRQLDQAKSGLDVALKLKKPSEEGE